MSQNAKIALVLMVIPYAYFVLSPVYNFLLEQSGFYREGMTFRETLKRASLAVGGTLATFIPFFGIWNVVCSVLQL